MPTIPYLRVVTALAMIASGADLDAAASNQPDIAPTNADTSAAQAGRLADRILAELVAVNGVPGMGAAVWQGGRVVWRGAAGYQDLAARTPVDADTRFRFASVSKLMTVAAAVRLANDGALDIDAPVSSLWAGVNPAWSPFTVRQLASHTAGLPHYQAQDEHRGGRRFTSTAEAVGVFRERPLLFSPGDQYSYSSWGYTLMSAIIEARADQPFLDYLSQHITPGLAIGVDATGSGNPHASKAYEFVAGQPTQAPPHDFSYTWAGGGLGGTPAALAEFGGRMMTGAVVPPGRFEAMLVPTRLNDGSETRDEDYRIGFGWRTMTDQDGRLRVQHAGVTVGARSALVAWPALPAQQQSAVSLLSNALWVSSIEQSAAMIAAPFQPAPAGLIDQACPLASSRFEGRFREMAVEGRAAFTVADGVCTGTLSLEGAFKGYFDAFVQKDAEHLRVVGIDAEGGLSRAALVTPIGIYDLRSDASGRHRAAFGAKSELIVDFISR